MAEHEHVWEEADVSTYIEYEIVRVCQKCGELEVVEKHPKGGGK